MYNAAKIALAVAGASAIAVGGTAFTNSNTMPGTMVVGNGTTAATGVVVTGVAYTQKVGDTT